MAVTDTSTFSVTRLIQLALRRIELIHHLYGTEIPDFMAESLAHQMLAMSSDLCEELWTLPLEQARARLQSWLCERLAELGSN
jgi:leucyl aminopeptidase